MSKACVRSRIWQAITGLKLLTIAARALTVVIAHVLVGTCKYKAVHHVCQNTEMWQMLPDVCACTPRQQQGKTLWQHSRTAAYQD